MDTATDKGTNQASAAVRTRCDAPNLRRSARRAGLGRTGPFLLLALLLSYPAVGWGQQPYASNQSVVTPVRPSAPTFDRTRLDAVIAVRHEDAPLLDVLQALSHQSGFTLSYGSHPELLAHRVTLVRDRITVLEALHEAIRGTDFSLKVSRNEGLIVTRDPNRAERAEPVPERAQVPAQTGTLFGRVVEADTGGGLPGVNVTVVGTGAGAATDLNGRYRIPGLAPGAYTVRASFIGYRSEEVSEVPVTDGEETELNFVLEEDVAGLEEVVVVGYGEQRLQDVTGSISSISSEDIAKIPTATIDQALQGRAAGVQVTQASSEPGGGVRIRIRGAGSINAGNGPLYVIDGLPIDNSMPLGLGAGAIHSATPRNPLSALNPADVASVEVLKDASATAIYGARGANGVILVTTKSGRGQGLRVEYNGYGGMQEVSRTLDLLNAREYMELVNGIRQDLGQPPPYTPEEIAAAGEGTDWQDEIFETAPITSHQLALSGGAEATRYYTSFGYFNQQGVVRTAGVERYVARLNLTHAWRRFNFGLNLNTSLVENDYAPVGGGVNAEAGAIFAALQMPPNLPVYDEDGGFTDPQNDLNNPVALIEGFSDEADLNRTFGTAYAEYDVLDGLTARLNVGSDRQNGERRVYESNLTIFGRAARGRATVTASEQSTSLGELTLTYNKLFKQRHLLTLLGGATYQVFDQSFTRAQAEGFPADITETYNLALGENFLRPASSRQKSQLLSYLGRANYTFADKYLLTGTFRVDGSSRFGENSKFGYFPSLALGWRLSEESFLERATALDDLKLRLSYGVTGNQEIGNYNSLLLLTSGATAVIGEQPVIETEPSRIANPDLQWEETTQYDIGLDFSFFGGRLNGSLDYFVKDTDNLLLAFPVPTSTGFNQVIRNAGNVRNKGFEAALNTINLDGPFEWTSSLTFATLDNEVTDLAGAAEVIMGGVQFVPNFTIIREGAPLNAYYGFVVDGIVQEGQTLPAQPDAQPSDLIVRDVNGDGQITADDRQILGSPFPDVTLGLQNNFRYKNFGLSFFLDAVFGRELFNANWTFTDYPVNPERNRLADPLLDRWTPTNPSTEHPSGVLPSRYAGNAANSRAVEDGSYVRLQNVTLTYDLPVQRVGALRSASLYFGVQNVFTITDYSGYSPDVSSQGGSNVLVDFNAYPATRTFTLGLNVGL